MNYRKTKNYSRKTKNYSRKTKRNKSKKSKKMRGGQDEKPQNGSLRLYRDENPQF
jgi:hypothetical protein